MPRNRGPVGRCVRPVFTSSGPKSAQQSAYEKAQTRGIRAEKSPVGRLADFAEGEGRVVGGHHAAHREDQQQIDPLRRFGLHRLEPLDGVEQLGVNHADARHPTRDHLGQGLRAKPAARDDRGRAPVAADDRGGDDRSRDDLCRGATFHDLDLRVQYRETRSAAWPSVRRRRDGSSRPRGSFGFDVPSLSTWIRVLHSVQVACISSVVLGDLGQPRAGYFPRRRRSSLWSICTRRRPRP